MVGYTTYHVVPEEMLDDEAALKALTHGQPYQVASDYLHPERACIRITWLNRAAAVAVFGERAGNEWLGAEENGEGN